MMVCEGTGTEMPEIHGLSPIAFSESMNLEDGLKLCFRLLYIYNRTFFVNT